MHYLSTIKLEENSNKSTVEVLRVCTLHDRGMKITPQMLTEYEKNFKDNVYGDLDEAGKPEVAVNLEHFRGSEAAGWVKDLFVFKDKLMATVEWTEMGVDKITKKLFKFVSAELAGVYPHHENGKMFDNVFVGLALTNTPALKTQMPLALSEDLTQLFNNDRMLKTLLSEMKTRAFVSKADKELVTKLLAEASDEQKEEVKADAEEVSAKPEAPVESEEDKKVREEKEAKEVADKKAAEEAQQLAEKTRIDVLAAKDAEIKALQDKIAGEEVNKLSETFLASEKRATGFAGDGVKEKVSKFLTGLSQEQRTEFTELMTHVQTVDLSTKGADSTASAQKSKEELLAEAETKAKEMHEKTKKPLHDCLAEVYLEMKLTN